MAQKESDREDLLREATALVSRAELRIGGVPIVAGYRRNGAFSLFWDVDPVYQFNPNLQFRRGYLQGDLLKAEDGRIVELRRERTPQQVALVRRTWSPDEQAEYLAAASDNLRKLEAALARGDFELAGAVTDAPGGDGPLLEAIGATLRQLLAKPIAVAARPHAG